ncbi:hypothetical protein G6010_05380 [Dietzia sp. SLG510A3-3B2-2]|nr:hypothetical protein [Dietzia sp. SLG510A3-40A3]MBB1009027.1 hypothetical protein [Dietzia sp. SLG510A3-3B2-2]
MARMNTTSRATAVDLVDDFLESPAVAQMLGYAAQAGPNQVSLACHDLRAGRAVVVDSALLPAEVSGEFHDPVRLTSVRLRLQRGHAPEVVDDRAPVVAEEPEEPTVDTVPLEVTP